MIESRRTALVTGGGGGLGAAICRRLAEDGLHVCVVDIAAENVKSVADALVADVLSASAHVCDVTSSAELDTLAGEIIQRFGDVSILVNLAGAVRNAVLSKVTDDDFDVVLTTHLVATMRTVRAFAPGMKRQAYGRIVNTSSIAARGTVAGISYSAAKGGIEGLTRSAAIELAPHGVTVNCIEPGVVATGMFLSTPKEFQDAQVSRIPARRAGTPDEIAACVSFLASSDSSYVNGQTLTACGGLSVGAFK
ncbi:SDR family NAD(P)-dependent oxidoreductase [Sciscionella marina]|uniref:SDR family NAD(P)-dependent oxidoreductase n=1 Tax=Sciscionella marina TaxID=508770 RepID=UPI0003613460|nr:SDR family NAD(P)-dependent oxidoreductase [Sciscionella marina]